MSDPPSGLRELRQAGRVAAAARELGAREVVAGARLRDVCAAVEDEIRRRGAEPAFPAQSSCNEVAAHYCPSPEDATEYQPGDLAKLDIGVHVDGYVVDTAVTVNVGDLAENRPLVAAARAALEAAIALTTPGVPVRRLSREIESTLAAHGLRPMRNLCGHGVGRWTVHCPPPIPNAADEATPEQLLPGMAVAIEPFATSGMGILAERPPAEVFRLDPQKADGAGIDAGVLGALRRFCGLPFSRRQLAACPRERVEQALLVLRTRGLLQAYPPLVEKGGYKVAQAEHTLFVGEHGVEVLTR